MKKTVFILISLLLLSLLNSSERITPLDIYILLDKSLSMEESGAFDDVKQWMTSSFIDDSLIPGDTVYLYFFYGNTQKAYAKTLANKDDFLELKNLITQSSADGAFTDIGLALDTIKNIITTNSGTNQTAAFVITDLIQEASYGSKYAGTYYDFARKYMTEDRIIPHTIQDSKASWYEITVQTGNLKSIENRAQKIYNTIKNTTNEPLYLAQNRNL